MSPIRIEQTEPRRVDVKYVAVMAGVLLIIVAVVTQMYLLERARRLETERRYGEVLLKLEMQQAEGWPAWPDVTGQSGPTGEAPKETVPAAP